MPQQVGEMHKCPNSCQHGNSFTMVIAGFAWPFLSAANALLCTFAL